MLPRAHLLANAGNEKNCCNNEWNSNAKGGTHNVKAARKNVKHAPRVLHNGSVISELQREKMYATVLHL